MNATVAAGKKIDGGVTGVTGQSTISTPWKFDAMGALVNDIRRRRGFLPLYLTITKSLLIIPAIFLNRDVLHNVTSAEIANVGMVLVGMVPVGILLVGIGTAPQSYFHMINLRSVCRSAILLGYARMAKLTVDAVI